MRDLPFAIPRVGRFLITGGLLTAISALCYLAFVHIGMWPAIATVIAHGLGLVVGFFMHGRWSFAGSTLNTAAAARFFIGSMVTLMMNSGWTELCTGVLDLPNWTPVLPMLFITPPISYALNAIWVFRAKGKNERTDPS